MTFKTNAAYVSGALCGELWTGGKAGYPFQASLRSFFKRSGPGASFHDALSLMLTENGGDFQGGASFTADTIVRIERRSYDGPGKYRIHVREREIADFCDCGGLADPDCYVGDFIDD